MTLPVQSMSKIEHVTKMVETTIPEQQGRGENTQQVYIGQ